MTISTQSAGTVTVNVHTCTGNSITVVSEGNFDGCRIKLMHRKNKGSASPRQGYAFDDTDGRNIIGPGVRTVSVIPGMIIWPSFEGGKVNSDISVEIQDS